MLSVGAVFAAKYRKNSKLELYNQFLFCNMFLLFCTIFAFADMETFFQIRRHEEHVFLRQEDMKNMFSQTRRHEESKKIAVL